MKKVILLILVVLGTLMSTRSSAQLYAMRDSVQNGYNFWLYLPEGYEDMRAERLEHPDSAEIKSPMPIVLFLHGRSLSGTDLSTVRKYGTIDAVKRGRKVNAVVIAPQVNHGDWWRPERLMNVIKWVSKRYDVDLTRLYVLGMSLGGYGTLDFAATYPEHTAAAIALCGGSTLRATALGKLNEVPLWIMHGTGDASVAVSESRRVKRAMEAANPQRPRVRYDEWVGAGHSIYACTCYMDEAY
jgi:predicted peptidase